MELYDQDELYELMEYIIFVFQYKCYLKFMMPGSCKKSSEAQLRVVVPQLSFIAIGFPLNEVMEHLAKLGVEQTSRVMNEMVKIAIEKIKRDNPGLDKN